MTLGKTAKSVLKWAFYSLLLLLLHALQATPALFSIHGIKPVLVIPLAVSVALFENEVGSGAFGLAAGLLWDFSAGKLFGFYGMVLMVCCICVSLLSMYFMKVNLTNAVLLSAGTGFLLSLWNFIFYYLIWGYGNAVLSFTKLMLVLVYTVILAGPIYLLVRLVAMRLNPVLRA